MAQVFLGLGSNVGDRFVNLKNAIEKIKNIEDTEVIQCSSIYETEPWGKRDQDFFYNMAAEVNSKLIPFKLIYKLKDIENQLGRIRTEKWEERNIDIDILFYEDEVIITDFLEIPHPEIEKRKFVLVPLNEIAPDFIHPVYKKTISELLESTEDDLKVVKLNLKTV